MTLLLLYRAELLLNSVKFVICVSELSLSLCFVVLYLSDALV